MLKYSIFNCYENQSFLFGVPKRTYVLSVISCSNDLLMIFTTFSSHDMHIFMVCHFKILWAILYNWCLFGYWWTRSFIENLRTILFLKLMRPMEMAQETLNTAKLVGAIWSMRGEWPVQIMLPYWENSFKVILLSVTKDF